MKKKKLISIVLVLAMFVLVIPGCGSGDSDADVESGSSEDADNNESEDVQTADEDVPEGKDTNNGRPYNLSPTKHDSRDDEYLYGINATKLPITEDDVTLVIWRSFNSSVIQGLDENEAIQEFEKRTGVKTEFVYPPVGQEEDNFNLRIASDDIPHIFSDPPEYAGGYRKAVEDDIYLELTPYYDKDLMPNIKWLRENYEEIDRDIVDDDGGMYFFPMIDIVPTHPWSGLWVRADWLEELGLDIPETIDDWEEMLKTMKEAKGIAPLGFNIENYYGVRANYMFVAAYETGREWINKDGKAIYGPIEPGYKEFLTKMNEWYEAGLIDPDFATRDNDSYHANIANGNVGAAGMAYGEVGQMTKTGRETDPNFELKPVVQPISYDGQEIHLRQNNSIVRDGREFLTTRVLDDDIDEIAVAWKDYWYSQDGGDLCSYGPEGISYEWNEDGEYEWIYPELDNDEGLDFWSLYSMFKLGDGWGHLRNSAAYEFEPEVHESIETWSTQKADWVMPENVSHTTEEAKELANIMVDINTYRDEMTLKFIMGQEPISKFDDFVATIKGMNIDRAIEIKNAALERYNNR